MQYDTRKKKTKGTGSGTVGATDLAAATTALARPKVADLTRRIDALLAQQPPRTPSRCGC